MWFGSCGEKGWGFVRGDVETVESWWVEWCNGDGRE